MALPDRRRTPAPREVAGAPYDAPPPAEAPVRIGPDPFDLALAQSTKGLDWLEAVASGRGLRWLWPSLQSLIGPLLPGWTVAIGARPQCGKTTLLLTQALAWASSGHPVCVIGTETDPGVLRVQLAALSLGLPVGAAMTGELDTVQMARIKNAVMEMATDQSEDLIIADQQSGRTLADVLYWIHYAADRGAEAVIFDHLHELDLTGSRDHTNDLGEAVKRIGAATVERQVVLMMAAQFNRGQGADPLLLHEVPTETMFRGTDVIQHKAVVSLQLWRPLRPGVTNEQKRCFREQRPLDGQVMVPTLDDLVQPETMALKVAKHRYRNSAWGQIRRLRIADDVISEFDHG